MPSYVFIRLHFINAQEEVGGDFDAPPSPGQLQDATQYTRPRFGVSISPETQHLPIDQQVVVRSQFLINVLNAQDRFEKYYLRLCHPIYIAAVVLVPWQKWQYYKKWHTSTEVDEAKILVKQMYDSYDTPEAPTSSFAMEVDLDSHPHPVVKEDGIFLSHFNSGRGTASSAIEDEYDRYCADMPACEGSWESALDWWKAHQNTYPRLARMAQDILSIPAMSAEVERLFSSAKLMLPPARNALLEDGIEAGECLLNWKKNGLF